jgi:LacI family transcriptional regulator
MDYRPNLVARGLRLRRADAIALVVPTTTSYVYPEIIDGAQDAAEEHDYALFLVKSLAVDPNDRLLSVVGHGRIDGLIFADIPSPEFMEHLMARAVPHVSLNRCSPDDHGYVALDDEAGFAAQADYLASRGHRVVAFVAGALDSFVQVLCIQGFRRGLAKHGVDLPDSRLLESDFEGEGGDAVAEQLLALNPRPTAVATSSVITASRIVQAFRARSIRVPEEISVIGYHDSPAALWPPPGISTVKMPSRVQGRRGVECLLTLLSGQPFDGEMVNAPPEIIERGTTANLVG